MIRVISTPVVIWLLLVSAAAAGTLRLHMIAVGHGDAILIEVDGDAVALVDAGAPQAGADVLAYLRQNGFSRIERLVATHPHDDHIGGMSLILDSLDVGVILLPGIIAEEGEGVREFRHFDRYVQSGRWEVDTVGAGDMLARMGGLEIEVLSPDESSAAGKSVDANEYSLVLRVRYGDFQAILAADINRAMEARLVERYGAMLKSDVLKSPHHGSGAGTSEDFLRAVSPDIVVVSTGPSCWGYPSEKTIRRLRELVPTVLRTDEVGTVVLRSDGSGVIVESPERTAP